MLALEKSWQPSHRRGTLALGFHRARMGGRNVAGLTARLSVTKVLRSCNTRHRITAGLRWLGVREVTQ